MKKKLSLIAALVCSFCLAYGATKGKCGDNVTWEFNANTGTLVISGTGMMKGYGEDDVPWSAYRKKILKVQITEGVTSIASYAFFNCTQLSSVTIPETVNDIYYNAFDGCANLSTVILPTSMKRINQSAFCHCTGLRSIVLPSGLEYIGQHAFARCTQLETMDFPSSLSQIGFGAFYKCSNLKEITFSSKYITISREAFCQCIGLTSVDFAESKPLIGASAFAGCTSLTSLIFPLSVQSLDGSAFSRCSSLQTVYYPQERGRINYQSTSLFPTETERIEYDPMNPPVVHTSSKVPPFLALLENSRVFSDASQNNRIDADEKCYLRFKVANNGKGPATQCEARITVEGTTSGITAKSVKIPIINAGQTYDVEIPITSNINTQDGKVTFSVEVYEPNGFGVAPFGWSVETKAYEAPLLQVVDYNIASTTGKIQKMVPFTLQFNLQNTKYGNAENVKVKVNLPKDVFVMDGKAEHMFPVIKSGEVKQIQLQLAANNNYTAANIPVTIDIKEKHGKFAENKQLDVALNQTTSSSINIVAKDEPQVERKEIQLAMITSEVDRNIPVTSAKSSNTFVLIIANEHYQQVASVPFALNDGNIFREYCIKTLGISEKHIKYLSDATGNQLKAGINWLANLTEAFDSPQIIVYYAGHGIPDEASKTAYLLPVDGNGSDVTTGYKLDDLYTTLGSMPASQITVFMDACFSGSKREQGMLAEARGVALKAKSGVPQGNMVVFSAAQGDETAFPYREQQHGMFTYHLLKKLQETSGDVTLQELGDYIIREVKKRSIEENDKKQTPCVTPSAAVGTEWQGWKLK